MQIPKLYLDNNAVSGFFDARWMDDIRELWTMWKDKKTVHLVASQVTADEAKRSIVRSPHVYVFFLEHFPQADLLPLTDEANALAHEYVRRKVLTANHLEDAQHVAICTLNKIKWLISGNFDHLANPNKAAKFNEVNKDLPGQPFVNIVSPDEYLRQMV